MKKFFAEFKEFINKGSVMDMAVGIIIGGAFTAIVNALVNSILMPIIGAISGGVSVENMAWVVIDFLLVALVLFSIIKAINKAKNVVTKPEEEAEEAPAPTDIELLTEIRDLLKENK